MSKLVQCRAVAFKVRRGGLGKVHLTTAKAGARPVIPRRFTLCGLNLAGAERTYKPANGSERWCQRCLRRTKR